jgi:hypothetical protein
MIFAINETRNSLEHHFVRVPKGTVVFSTTHNSKLFIFPCGEIFAGLIGLLAKNVGL